jgi:hypothetical protein
LLSSWNLVGSVFEKSSFTKFVELVILNIFHIQSFSK